MTANAQHTAETPTGHRAAAAWLILAVLLLFSIAAPLNQFKVPPIIPVLMTSLGLSVSGAGMLMSVYAVTGLILAIPSGFILQRVGFRITGLIAGGSIVIGSVLGALSATTGTLLVESRDRGRGHGFHGCSGPRTHRTVVRRIQARHGHGHLVGLGAHRHCRDAHRGAAAGPGVRLARVWWFGAIYALAVTVLYLVVVRPAPLDGVPAPADGHPAGERQLEAGVAKPEYLAAGAAFAGFIAVVIGSSTYLPTFLATQRAYR